jgi:hypothetical protein
MTPLERAARVLCDLAGRDPDEVCVGEGNAVGQTWMGWEAFVENARDVIAAIREPSEEMRLAGIGAMKRSANPGLDHHDMHVGFTAMIDALLEEQ